MRVHGTCSGLKFRELTPKDMETLVYEIMEEDWRMQVPRRLDFDFAYEIPDWRASASTSSGSARGWAPCCARSPPRS
jgi:Tfp pilus assembly pilus retraction ATPase PilT